MTTTTTDVTSLPVRAGVVWRDIVRHYRRHWYNWLIAVLALMLVDQCLMFGVNLSQSLPQRIFITSKLERTLKRGDYVTFRWHGGGPYGAGHAFTKIVKGLPGDVVTWEGRNVFVNGQMVAQAKTHSKTGMPLEVGPSGVIPPGRIFVYGTNKDSLDSRYAISGWIDERAVIGKAYGFF